MAHKGLKSTFPYFPLAFPPIKCTKQRVIRKQTQAWIYIIYSKEKKCFQQKWKWVEKFETTGKFCSFTSAMFQLFPDGPRRAFLRIWMCGRSRNPEISRGWSRFLLDLLVKMLLSFFIQGGSPSNCIPHSSLSGITNMRRSLL